MTNRVAPALSDFIDSLPAEASEAQRLFAEVTPLSGNPDMADLAQLALMIRAIPQPEPRAAWLAATKQRLLAALRTGLQDRGDVIWLGSMFVPPKGCGWPKLRRFRWVRTGAVAAAVALAISTTAIGHPPSLAVSSPLMQVVDQAF